MRIKNVNLLIGVSSCKAFYEKTLDKNIYSLLEAQIPAESILLVVGGFPDKEEAEALQKNLRDKYGIPKIYVEEQNSFEYIPLIYIVEHEDLFKEYDYVFNMHDTCWVGPNFKYNLEVGFPDDGRNTCALDHGLSMNIGAYKISWLKENYEKLMIAKNMSSEPVAIQAKKNWGVHNEDHLLRYSDGTFPQQFGARYENITLENPYKTNIPRRIRYFEYLDIYKAQSNWNGDQPHMNVTP